jgi:hypothetical protein
MVRNGPGSCGCRTLRRPPCWPCGTHSSARITHAATYPCCAPKGAQRRPQPVRGRERADELHDERQERRPGEPGTNPQGSIKCDDRAPARPRHMSWDVVLVRTRHFWRQCNGGGCVMLGLCYNCTVLIRTRTSLPGERGVPTHRVQARGRHALQSGGGAMQQHGTALAPSFTRLGCRPSRDALQGGGARRTTTS